MASGIGAEVTVLAGFSGSISFVAAGSGGAIIDCAATSGVAGVAEDFLATDETVKGPGSAAVASTGGLSVVLAAAVATGATTGAGGAFCAAGDGSAVAAGGAAAACGEDAAAALCRAIAPVTESRPCSSTVTREYSRSRSPLRVSTADASRRVSLWLSLAASRICCAWRASSSAATSSRRNDIEDWLASRARMTAPTAPTPHDPIRHSARRSKASSSAKRPDSAPPVFSVSKLSVSWLEFFAIRSLWPSRAPESRHKH